MWLVLLVLFAEVVVRGVYLNIHVHGHVHNMPVAIFAVVCSWSWLSLWISLWMPALEVESKLNPLSIGGDGRNISHPSSSSSSWLWCPWWLGGFVLGISCSFSRVFPSLRK